MISPLPERLSARITAWKQKLLDLTKRNRALNFKVQKVSTVTIVDEQPTEVFRQLWLQEKTLRFRPMLPPNDKNTGGKINRLASAEPESIHEDEDESLGADFAPYDPAQLDERHTDD